MWESYPDMEYLKNLLIDVFTLKCLKYAFREPQISKFYLVGFCKLNFHKKLKKLWKLPEITPASERKAVA